MANNKSGEGIDLKIASNFEKPKNDLQEVLKYLRANNMQIVSVTKSLGNQEATVIKASNGWKEYTATLNSAGEQLKQIQKADFSALTDNIKGALTSIKTNVRIAYSYIKGWTLQASDFNEAVNKFNVSMGTSVNQATKFQNKLQEAFGTAKDEMMDYQSTFKNIMSVTGNLSEKQAEEVSESLVKMALDYSSLYNVDQATAMQKYESAMTGQIRPIRSGSGYDISQQTVLATSQSLGITRAYSELSEMEKRLLRIITLMNQMKNTGAMQDFARTIEQPANQLKVLKNQIQEIGVWIGNVFIGILGKALPYINGFLMAVKELIKTFAIFVGYQGDTSTNLSDVFESAETSSSGISSNLGSAAGSAKELKKQLMGFDKLNVINTANSNTGGSSGSIGGGVGSIDPKILNALKEYDNLMEGVRMKATDIRDRIMEWLGFTKEINPETGEITWKLKDGLSNLKLILGILAVIASAAIIGKIVKAIQSFKNVFALGSALKNFNKLSKTGDLKKITDAVGSAGDSSKKMKSFSVPSPKTILKGLGDLSLIVGGVIALTEAVGLFMKIPGAEETLNQGLQAIGKAFLQIGKVSPFIAAAAAGFKVMGKIGVSTFAKGLADFAIIVGGIEGVVLAVGAVMSIKGFKNFLSTGITTIQTTFKKIGEIFLPLVGLSAMIGIMGAIGVSVFAKGLADLAIVILGTEAVITAVGFISSLAGDFISTGVATIQQIFNGLWTIAIPIVGMSAIMAALAVAGPVVIAGIAQFSLIAASLEALLIIFGIISKIPFVATFTEAGGELLVTLATYIGKFAGALINGFLDKAFEGIAEIGAQLSEFMTNAQPFFEGLNNIDENKVNAVSNLASMVLKLTIVDIIDGIKRFFGIGENSLIKFGKELSEFGPYFNSYAKSIKDVNGEAVEASANAASSLAEFAHKLNNESGILAKIVGDNTLTNFGRALPEFGKNFKAYYDNINGINGKIIEESSNAALSIANLANKLPNQGGIISWFTGDNKLDKFSACLPEFGKNLKAYYDNIKGVNGDVIQVSANAASSISEFASKLPNKGGIVSWFTGDNSLKDFGKELKSFGDYFKKYYDTVSKVGIDKINDVTKALNTIIENYKTVKQYGLVSVISDFGNALKTSAGDIANYFNSSLDWNKGNSIGQSFGSGFANGMSSAIRWSKFPKLKLTGPDGNSLQNYRLSFYEKGGFPKKGQLFFANEGAPELIGQIGNQTAVANNQQIIQGITNGVAEGMTRVMRTQNDGGSINVYLDGDQLMTTIQKRQDRYANMVGA